MKLLAFWPNIVFGLVLMRDQIAISSLIYVLEISIGTYFIQGWTWGAPYCRDLKSLYKFCATKLISNRYLKSRKHFVIHTR